MCIYDLWLILTAIMVTIRYICIRACQCYSLWVTCDHYILAFSCRSQFSYNQFKWNFLFHGQILIQRILLGHGFPTVSYLVWYCTILMQNVMGGSVKHWISVYMALQLPWILYLFQNRSYKNNKNWLAQNWIQISFLNILLPTKHGFILYVLVSNKTNEQCFS